MSDQALCESTVCCSVLQCVAGMLQCSHTRDVTRVNESVTKLCVKVQCVAVCCSVLQCVAYAASPLRELEYLKCVGRESCHAHV